MVEQTTKRTNKSVNMPRKFTIRIFDLPLPRSILLLIFFLIIHVLCVVFSRKFSNYKVAENDEKKKRISFVVSFFFSIFPHQNQADVDVDVVLIIIGVRSWLLSLGLSFIDLLENRPNTLITFVELILNLSQWSN